MTYYPDMSKYAYFERDTEPRTLNVGWLEPPHAFRRRASSEAFVKALWAFCRVLVHPARGWEPCGFCDVGRDGPPLLTVAGQSGEFGFAEIRVFGPSGTVYAAPNLILHYVTAHRFRPPTEFIEAVTAGPRPPSRAYFARLRRHGVRQYWHYDEEGELQVRSVE